MITRFANAVRRIDERRPGAELPLLSVSQTRGVLRQGELTGRPPRAESLDPYKTCRRGDIVFNKMSIRTGAMGVAREDGLVTYHYEVLRPIKGVLSSFIFYLMKSDYFTAELIKRERGIGAGGQSGVRTTEVPFSSLRLIDIYLPSLTEQELISQFLGRETEKIDALIAKQEQLIATLDERIRATVSAAVERGEIGTGSRIPGVNIDRWSQSRLRHLVFLNPSPKSLLGSELSKQVNFLPMNAIGEEGELDLERIEVAADLTGSYSFFADGDVLMAKVTPCFENGKGAVVAGTLSGFGFATTEVSVLRPKGHLSADFLYYLLHTSTFMNLGSSEMTGAGGLKRVPDAFLKNYTFLLPPFEEQQLIVNHLEERLGELRDLRATSRDLIQVMTERRQALISAAVTGKLEVSG